MRQLGYEVPADELATRIERRGDGRQVFVAVRDEVVAGWIAVCADEPFVEGFGAHVEGLVVEESERSGGIGAELLDAAESWARAAGCGEMRVQSNVIRTRAHAFYSSHGYATIKSQHQLRKRL
jgi:GNAT superfamily N-acetyltransferase